jgi:branched-chain amino acid aminotransferase
MKLAKQSGWRVEEKPISPKDIYSCDECFATMSGAGIVPVTSIWQRKIGQGVCGPLTGQLIRLYEAEITRISTPRSAGA